LHYRRGVVLRIAAIASLALAAGGCFYMDPINDRPSAELRRVLPVDAVSRGDDVVIEADLVDPDGDEVTLSWTAYGCAAGALACNEAAFIENVNGFVLSTSADNKFAFQVPLLWGDAAGTTAPVEAVRIVGRSVDAYGAIANLDAELVIDVANAAPTLIVQDNGPRPVGSGITITAMGNDVDDGEIASMSWMAYSPAGSSSFGFTQIGPDGQTETYLLEPDVDGVWIVEITAADALGAETTTMHMVVVDADAPPCIAATDPLVPPPGAVISLDELRRFAVLVVADDLDVWPPPPPNDPYAGEATFAWKIRSPATGGAFQPLGASASSVDLDPASYAPGDLVDLRVEVADRIPRSTCSESEPTCSLNSDGCLQRVTWSVEVR
jgi:hypothetical protein